jgi:hypothetical protein
VRLDGRAAHVHWVISAGRHEGRNGEVITLLNRLIGEIQEHPAPIRRCVGAWGHEGVAWRDISPGSLAWLFGFAAAADVETTTERSACHNIEPGTQP